MPTFNPDPNKVGAFIKPNFSNAPSFLGFKPDMAPVYKYLDAAHDPLIKKSAEDLKVAWSAFNAAITLPPEFSSALTSVKSVISTIDAVNKTLVLVLDKLVVFAEFNVNVFEAIIQSILLLIKKVVDLLNPSVLVSVHALIIPPRLGNAKSSTSTTTNKIIMSAESLSSLKNSSIELLNSSLQSIPSLSSLTLKTETGSQYLLNTITSKLNDFSDSNRPLLKQNSYYAGVGLFIGASNINAIINQWDKIIKVMGLIDANYQDKSIPPEPTIVGPKTIFSTDTLDNIVTYPILPLTESGATSLRGNAVWTHTARYELATNKLVTKTELAVLDALLSGYLSNPDNVKNIATNTVRTIEGFNSVYIWFLDSSKGTVSPEYSWKLTEKGTLGLCSIDVYTVLVDDKPIYIARKSKLSECKFDPSYKGIINFQSKIDFKGSASAKSPKWITASGTLSLVPTVFATLSTVLDLVGSWLAALTATALNAFSSIINTLKLALKVVAQITTLISEFTVLIDQILSVNLSCSGITFAGSGGGNVSLEAIFKQYFTNSGAESSFGTTGINLTVSNSQLTSELAEAVSSADSLSALDERAKQIFDAQTKTRLEKEAELDKALSSRQFYTADAGKVSPSFDAKDTTAGLVLLAYSDISSNVQTAKLLFDLLLNAASPSSHSSTTTEEAISNQAAIPLDFLAVLPTSITNVEALTGSPVFFGENMLPVSSEDQSPFRFCP